MNDVATLSHGVEANFLPFAIRQRIGEDFGSCCDPVRISYRFHVLHHIRATGDNNPIHIDKEAARLAGLPGVIAHGDLVVGMLPRLLGPLFGEFQNAGVGLIYHGMSECIFVRRVLVGEAIKARVRVLSPKPPPRQYARIDGAIELDYDFEILHADSNKLVTAGTKYLICFPTRHGEQK